MYNNSTDALVNAINGRKLIMQPISIYVDKLNRREYLIIPKHELKYKVYHAGAYVFASEKEMEKNNLVPNNRQAILEDEKLMHYGYEDTMITVSSIVGTLLCDFLNCKFTDYKSLKAFTDKYSLMMLTEMLTENGYDKRMKILFTKQEYERLISDIAIACGHNLEKKKEKFIADIENCYNMNDKNNNLTPYEIYTKNGKDNKTYGLYSKEKTYLEFDTIINQSNVEATEEHILSPYIISSVDLNQILFVSFKELMCIDKFPMKKCKNCGKYFVPDKRTDEFYCNNYFNDTGKTCKEIGFFLCNQRKLREDEVARIYRNTYQQKLLRASRHPDNEDYKKDLEDFRTEYKEIKKQVRTGEMSQEEFKEWILEKKK